MNQRNHPTSPYMWKVHVSSSRSMLVTPGTLRACWMLAPCVPMARPIKSSRTANCSWKRDASCLELFRHTTREMRHRKTHFVSTHMHTRSLSYISVSLIMYVCVFTSSCLLASSFLSMRDSLVRRLLKCMSLIMLARFVVTSFTDCKKQSKPIFMLIIYHVGRVNDGLYPQIHVIRFRVVLYLSSSTKKNVWLTKMTSCFFSES